MDYSKLFDVGISAGSIKEWRASGRKAVGIICSHVPQELFHAAGILPVRLRATGCEDSSDGETWMSSFSCSFAKSILQYLIDGVYELDGVVTSDGCMLAVRIYDNWKYISDKEGKAGLVYEIGAPRKATPITKEFYRDELQELIVKLETLSGGKVTEEKLIKSIETYNEARHLLRQVEDLQKQEPPVLTGAQMLALHLSSTNMPIEEYIELLKAFLADADKVIKPEVYRSRIMLIGSALDNPEYIRIIESKGAIVVTDALCFGRQMLGDELPLNGGDPLKSIADYYLDRLVCPRMVDNRDALHEYIIKTAKEFKVDGIIYEKMQFCECWGGENVFLERELEEASIPLLNVEREQKIANAGQLEVRVEAFVEMIEKEV